MNLIVSIRRAAKCETMLLVAGVFSNPRAAGAKGATIFNIYIKSGWLN
jgi:hypothetical protein